MPHAHDLPILERADWRTELKNGCHPTFWQNSNMSLSKKC